MLIGSSLKMYFSHARTVEWMREVAAIVADHPAREYVTTFAIPQYPSIPAAVEIGGPAGIAIGAQDVATDDEGAFTGEVSGRVLAEIGCRYAEVGHAERRRLYGETEEVVARKVHAALRNGLVPILCVGEADEVEPAEAAAEAIRQIESGLAEARAAGAIDDIVIAYEPLWAIGAPRPAGADRIPRGVPCAARPRAERVAGPGVGHLRRKCGSWTHFGRVTGCRWALSRQIRTRPGCISCHPR